MGGGLSFLLGIFGLGAAAAVDIHGDSLIRKRNAYYAQHHWEHDPVVYNVYCELSKKGFNYLGETRLSAKKSGQCDTMSHSITLWLTHELDHRNIPYNINFVYYLSGEDGDIERSLGLRKY